jgi:two-component system nitrate/nitrite response regulator NarL
MDNVVLAIKSQLFRDGLRLLLSEAGFTVIGELSQPADIMRLTALFPDQPIDLVIIEASLCFEDRDLIANIRQSTPHVRLAILAEKGDLLHVGRRNIMAADSILSLEISGEIMVQSLRLVQLGQRMVPLDLIASLLRSNAMRLQGSAPSGGGGEAEPEGDDHAPSQRETEILRCLIEGSSNKVIARKLGITEATVKVHLKGLLRKIKAANRTQAAIWALNNGIAGLQPVPSKDGTPEPCDA